MPFIYPSVALLKWLLLMVTGLGERRHRYTCN